MSGGTLTREKLAKHEQRSEWAMKIGMHHQPSVKNRFDDYKVAVPHTPTVGLLVACEKASVLERTVHSTLTNREKIGEMGTEWFTTSVASKRYFDSTVLSKGCMEDSEKLTGACLAVICGSYQ